MLTSFDDGIDESRILSKNEYFHSVFVVFKIDTLNSLVFLVESDG